MSEATATVDAPAADHDAHAHPNRDKQFVMLAVWLAVITAAEVAIVEIESVPSVPRLVGLLVMMAVKFVLVAGTFMHLKFDNKVLTKVFYAGVVLAIVVYLIALTAMEFFGGGSSGGPGGNINYL